MHFTIGKKEIQKRSKNIKMGAFFATVLVVFIGYHNNQYPAKYNDVLFWSIMGFIILANMIGFYRYRRYLKMVKEHWVEVFFGKMTFTTHGDISELNFDDIAALNFYYHKKILEHIQIKLKNNRGIRLEGYDKLDSLAELISEQVPKAHITGNK